MLFDGRLIGIRIGSYKAPIRVLRPAWPEIIKEARDQNKSNNDNCLPVSKILYTSLLSITGDIEVQHQIIEQIHCENHWVDRQSNSIR